MKHVLIVGAGQRTENLLRALDDIEDVAIEGIYDQKFQTTALDMAAKRQITLFAGATSKLPQMLEIPARNGQTHYYIFVPSDHMKFRSFVNRQSNLDRENTTPLFLHTHFKEIPTSAEISALLER